MPTTVRQVFDTEPTSRQRFQQTAAILARGVLRRHRKAKQCDPTTAKKPTKTGPRPLAVSE